MGSNFLAGVAAAGGFDSDFHFGGAGVALTGSGGARTSSGFHFGSSFELVLPSPLALMREAASAGAWG